MRLFTSQNKRLTLTMLGVAATEEATSMPAAKNPSAKEMRKEETFARIEQTRDGDQHGR